MKSFMFRSERMEEDAGKDQKKREEETKEYDLCR